MATAAAGARRTAPGLRQLVPLPIPGSSLARARGDPLAFMTEATRRFGDVFRHRWVRWCSTW